MKTKLIFLVFALIIMLVPGINNAQSKKKKKHKQDNLEINLEIRESVGEIDLKGHVIFYDSLTKYFYVDSNGSVPVNMIVELPKYYISAKNEIVLHPTITIRQNGIETKSIQLEPINIEPTEIQLNQKDVQQSISNNNVITIDLYKTLIQSEKKLKKKTDTSKICLYYENIINLNAAEYPGLDKIFIQFDGTVNKADKSKVEFKEPKREGEQSRFNCFIESDSNIMLDINDVVFCDSLVIRRAVANETYNIEFETIRIAIPDKTYKEGINALKNFNYIEAEELLKDYNTYNTALCYIARNKPEKAIEILESFKEINEFETIKSKRDHLTQLYINTDSTNIELKDSLLKQIEIVKDSMNRVGKIEFLKSKAYFMNFTRSGRKYVEYLDKALASYFNLMKFDKINGLNNKMITGEANNKSSVLGSDNYFIFTANRDKYLSLLHKMEYCDEKIQKYKLELVTQYWKEQKLAFTEIDKQEYNNLVEAYMYDYASEEELERFIMCEFNGIDINTLNSTKSVD